MGAEVARSGTHQDMAALTMGGPFHVEDRPASYRLNVNQNLEMTEKG